VTAEKISLAEYLLNLAAMMIKADSMDTKKALKKFEECQLILESEDQENPKISMMQRQVKGLIPSLFKNLESTLFEEGCAEAEAKEKAGDMEKKN